MSASPQTRRAGKRALVGGLGLALAVGGLQFMAAPAQANPGGTGLVISEVYGGGGNTGAPFTNDFVELYNPTNAPISVDGWSIQGRSAANTAAPTAGNITPLSGSVPANGYYLVQQAAGTTVTDKPLPPANATGGIAMGAAGWQIWLADTTAAVTPPVGAVPTGTANIIDFVGGATNATTFETAPVTTAPSATLSVQRRSATGNPDTDSNAADFVTAAPTPQAAPIVGAPLAATDPGDKVFQQNVAITPITLAATGGTAPYTWAVTTGTLPAGLTLSGNTISGTPTDATPTPVEITVTATDSAGTPDTATATFTIRVDAPLGMKTIAEIQGTGATSPFITTPPSVVTTRGVVTAAYPAGGLWGYYLQTPGTGGAIDLATHTASDGIFVRQPSGAIAVTPGQYVEVTGQVAEFAGATQLSVAATGVTVLPDTVTAPTPATTTTWPTSNADREKLEGMLYAPQGNFTVTNNYNTNQFGELGLARGDKPLIQPTVAGRPGSPEAAAQAADNAARSILLDDGSSTNFTLAGTSANHNTTCAPRPMFCLLNGNLTPPYISNDAPFRVGATGTFSQPVVLTEGGSSTAPTWRFQPTQTVTGPTNTNSPYSVPNTRTAAPDTALINADGTADLKVASFNVLNYFTTLGTDTQTCTAYLDRDDNGSTVNTGCNQRGAWDAQDFQRQQAKIVKAINALDADVIGLMEIENSAKLGETADEATNSLVAALNADAGSTVWAANPTSADLPPVADQDVITNAIIYKPAKVQRTGAARALGDQSTDAGASSGAFANAREPIAQAFTPVGGGEAFLLVVNHFKSKGSAGPFPNDTEAAGNGQGAGNESRKRQATALTAWVPTIQAALDVDDVILLGDFNSYAKEDPLEIIKTAGFTNLEEEAGVDKHSYSFGGMSGSLDHVFGNASVVERMTGADIWNINGGEPLPMEYSRWNYHSTDFHQVSPYRSSDHDPVVVGLKAAAESTVKEIQILGTNDFHGRISQSNGEAGASVLSGAVKQLRAQNPNTVFAAAGDLIGASTFESFIQQDEPTIEALNEAGLEVSAVGNHEFDAGYEDLVGRVQSLAEWEYLATNVTEPAGRDELAESWTKTMDGVKVGFVGAVTEDLPFLVSPAGIQGVTATDVVDAVNAEATALKTAGADMVIMLVHEGATSTALASATDNSAFGQIVTGANKDIDAIVSGHTHLAYNHSIPVPAWVTEGRTVTERPVVSAGQYGTNLNKLVFSYDTAADKVTAKSQEILALRSCGATCSAATPTWTSNYPNDQAVTDIVSAAVAEADVLGAEVLGKIGGAFNRAKLANGTTENRGGESTLGNLVAEVQRWATEKPESGSAQIAFMNPGGLRQDMVGTPGGYPANLTYKQAAVVQPFANTLVNMKLTGANIKVALEQQWQRDSAGAVPSRPFLRLGASKGFTYTYDVNRAEGDRITGMWLNGVAINPTTSYSVTVNSFLASGGDNFRAFNNGTEKRDTGKADLAAMVDYMDTYASTDALPVDYTQRAVGVSFPAGAPAAYTPGEDTVEVTLSSLAFSTAADVKDTEVQVLLGSTVLGTFPVDNTVGTDVRDEYGKASVSVLLPADMPYGKVELTVKGTTTGTTAPFFINVEALAQVVARDLTVAPGATTTIPISVVAGQGNPTGVVAIYNGATMLGQAPLQNGVANVAADISGLGVGEHTLTARYLGDGTYLPDRDRFTLTVKEDVPVLLTPTIGAGAISWTYGKAGSVAVTVTATGKVPTGTVSVMSGATVIGTATLSGGKATVSLKRLSVMPGKRVLTIAYSGDAAVTAGSITRTATVAKAAATVTAKVTTKKVVVKKTRAKLAVTVRSDAGVKVTGKVRIKVGTKTITRAVSGGKVTFTLPPFARSGQIRVVVNYLGSNLVKPAKKVIKVRVVKR